MVETVITYIFDTMVSVSAICVSVVCAVVAAKWLQSACSTHTHTHTLSCYSCLANNNFSSFLPLLQQRNKKHRINKPLVVCLVGFFWFLGGLPLCTNAGVYILNLMDTYSAGIPCMYSLSLAKDAPFSILRGHLLLYSHCWLGWWLYLPFS